MPAIVQRRQELRIRTGGHNGLQAAGGDVPAARLVLGALGQGDMGRVPSHEPDRGAAPFAVAKQGGQGLLRIVALLQALDAMQGAVRSHGPAHLHVTAHLRVQPG